MENRKIDINELSKLYKNIGFMNPDGGNYKERIHKINQVNDYLVHIIWAIKKLSTKKQIVLLDCGCGRSYLSFVVYYYCQEILKRNICIIGVDRNADLIEKCRKTALELKFNNMHFYCNDIMELNLNKTPDIVYCLHACDTATDMTVAKGIKENAKFIITVSCCQRTTMKQMKQHPLTGITRFKPYKERIVEMVSDTMRGLLLEQKGYMVDIFEFTTSRNTAKNVMIRATKGNWNSKKEEKAKDEYRKLKELFKIQPATEEYIHKL